MPRKRGSRKAVSEILGALMLVAILTALALIAYNYFTNRAESVASQGLNVGIVVGDVMAVLEGGQWYLYINTKVINNGNQYVALLNPTTYGRVVYVGTVVPIVEPASNVGLYPGTVDVIIKAGPLSVGPQIGRNVLVELEIVSGDWTNRARLSESGTIVEIVR